MMKAIEPNFLVWVLLFNLRHYLKAQRFTDVTIAVDESSFEAHRVVLSACSTYFRNVLSRLSDCPHPVIVIKEPGPELMAALLDYMYTGQMTVKQEVSLNCCALVL
jgi:hypothetical protein